MEGQKNKTPLDTLNLVKDGWNKFVKFRERRLSGIRTGVPKIDKVLLGLGGMLVISGAPKCNKSTLALQIAASQLADGSPVLMFDRENGRERTRARLLCQLVRASYIDVMTWAPEKLAAAIKTILKLPFYYTGRINNYEELHGWLTELTSRYDKPVFLIVDSVQKLPMQPGEGKSQAIQRWLEFFDSAKLDFEGKVIIIIVSEKSRGEGGKNYEEASLSGGKFSGEIEYTCEQLIDLRRGPDNTIICEVMANRDGMDGSRIELNKSFVDKADETSFCFLLE